MDWQVRDGLGVAVRRDGKGDTWANDHRKLGTKWHMRDGDETHRCVWEVERHEERRFVEMAFDSYCNKGKLVRKCGTVARIDRKASVDRAEFEMDNGAVCIAHLLQECRNDRQAQQGIGGRAFLVCGNSYPFTYIEIDPFSGTELRRETLLDAMSWHELYKKLGLEADRCSLEQWLLSSAVREEIHGR